MLTVAFFGDSIPVGTGVTPYARWIECRSKAGGRPFNVINNAYGGHTTAMFLSEWNTLVVPHTFDIACYQFGANDHYIDAGQSTPRVSLGQYDINQREIIDRLKNLNSGSAFNNGRPMILAIAPTYILDGGGGNNSRLSEYASVVRKVAEEKTVNFLDGYRITGDACRWDQALFQEIGLHNDGGTMHLTSYLHHVISKALGRKLRRMAYEGCWT